MHPDIRRIPFIATLLRARNNLSSSEISFFTLFLVWEGVKSVLLNNCLVLIKPFERGKNMRDYLIIKEGIYDGLVGLRFIKNKAQKLLVLI